LEFGFVICYTKNIFNKNIFTKYFFIERGKMRLINRLKEKEYLENRMRSSKAEMIVIYGRRRVGKTFLLSNVFKNALFLTADLSSTYTLMNSFLDEFKDLLDLPESIKISDWNEFFQLLLQYVKRSDDKTVVILDEFQYVPMQDKGFMSVFQKWWDREFIKQNVLFILCGSYIGMIERTALSQSSPIYGRRTGQYKIEPMQFQEASEFLGNINAEEKVKIFSITGGIPLYLNEMAGLQTFEQAVLKKCFSPGEFLLEEGTFLTMEEFTKDSALYFDILKTVASGRTTPNEIATLTGIQYNGLGTYLKKLTELNLLKKEYPFSLKTVKKKPLYFIDDDYLRFYFRFILPYKELIYRGESETALKRLDEKFSVFCSFTYEKIAKDFLWKTLKPDKIGRWWKKDKEIDIVAMKDNQLIVAECKWTNKPVDNRTLSKLQGKAGSLLDDLKVKTEDIEYYLFSRNGFKGIQKTDNIHLISLLDK